MTARYWHGGTPGLRPGDTIAPQPLGSGEHLVDGLADYWGGSYSSTWLAPSMALTRVLDWKTP